MGQVDLLQILQVYIYATMVNADEYQHCNILIWLIIMMIIKDVIGLLNQLHVKIDIGIVLTLVSTFYFRIKEEPFQLLKLIYPKFIKMSIAMIFLSRH